MAEFDKINTAKEINRKISKSELHSLFVPFFQDADKFSEDYYKPNQKMVVSSLPALDKGSEIMDLVDKNIYAHITTGKEVEADCKSPEDEKLGAYLYYKFKKEFAALQEILKDGLTAEELLAVIDGMITPEICNYVSSETIIFVFSDAIAEGLINANTLIEIYKRKAGISDANLLKEGNKLKYDSNDQHPVDGVFSPDCADYKRQANLGKLIPYANDDEPLDDSPKAYPGAQ